MTEKHIEQLMAYNVSNECKVCQERFPGYAELRDHVQVHGENFRAPYGHPEGPVRRRRGARTKKGGNGKTNGKRAESAIIQPNVVVDISAASAANAMASTPAPAPEWTPDMGGAQMQKLLDEAFSRKVDSNITYTVHAT